MCLGLKRCWPTADSGQDLTDEMIAQRVSVISQTFNPVVEPSSGFTVTTPGLIGIGALALALVGGIAGYVIYRRRKAAQEAEALALEAEAQRPELPTIDIDNVTNESQIRKQLENLAKRKPEEFVNLLRTWLVDE